MIEAIIQQEPISVCSKYPYIGIYKNSGDEEVIVLFTAHKTGTQIGGSGSFKNEIGKHHSVWLESEFKPYKGKVILKNK